MRMTADVDLIPRPDPANLELLAEALRRLRARILDKGYEGSEITAQLLSGATDWQLSTPAGGIDVIHEVPGGRPFGR